MSSSRAFSIQSLSLVTIIGAVVAVILLLLPFTDSFIAHTKLYLLLAAGLLVTVLYLVRAIKRNSLDFVLSPFTTPLMVFGAAALISSLFTNSYPVENLLGMGGAYVAMVLIAIFGTSLLPRDSARPFLTTLGLVGVVLFALSLLQFVGLGPAQWFNAMWNFEIPSGLIFNLAGSTLIALQVSVVGLVGIAGYYYIHRRLPSLMMAAVPILLIAVAVFGWSILPGKDTSVVLPSYAASWSVALDALRSPRSAIIGVGPESYVNVYAQFKPLWVNTQEHWNINFNQAANVPLTLIATMGLFGLAAWVVFALAALKMIKVVSRENLPLAWMVVAMLLLHLLLPTNLVMLTILGITLAVLGAAERHRLPAVKMQTLSARITNQQQADATTAHSNTVSPFNIIAIAFLLGALLLSYFVGQSYAAQVYMNESNKAAMKNDAVKTYELQQQAIVLNPYLDSFRRRYAMTNMLIAIAISNRADATEQDQQQISELLQQSIREARAATMLDPGDSQNWLTLAQIYEQMIGVTDEAVQWAIQSYVSAIETNPTDPSLRIALGGIFLGQEEYEQAANIFNGAIEVKPDFPNSYYNFAIAMENLERYEAAKSAYQQVLVLLDPDTEDYTQVTERLEAVEAILAERGETEEGAAGGAAGVDADQSTSLTPSILDQNLQPQQNVVGNPGGVELNRDGTSNTTLPADDLTGTPEATGEPEAL